MRSRGEWYLQDSRVDRVLKFNWWGLFLTSLVMLFILFVTLLFIGCLIEGHYVQEMGWQSPFKGPPTEWYDRYQHPHYLWEED